MNYGTIPLTLNQQIALNYMDAIEANAVRWNTDDMWYWRNDIRCHSAIADAFVSHMRKHRAAYYGSPTLPRPETRA